MQIADGPEFVLLGGGTVVDDGEVEFGFARAILVGPQLELAGELGIGHEDDPGDAADGGEVVEHVIDHRLAGHRQQRLGTREGQRIKTRGVAGRENDHVHAD